MEYDLSSRTSGERILPRRLCTSYGMICADRRFDCESISFPNSTRLVYLPSFRFHRLGKFILYNRKTNRRTHILLRSRGFVVLRSLLYGFYILDFLFFFLSMSIQKRKKILQWMYRPMNLMILQRWYIQFEKIFKINLLTCPGVYYSNSNLLII